MQAGYSGMSSVSLPLERLLLSELPDIQSCKPRTTNCSISVADSLNSFHTSLGSACLETEKKVRALLSRSLHALSRMGDLTQVTHLD